MTDQTMSRTSRSSTGSRAGEPERYHGGEASLKPTLIGFRGQIWLRYWVAMVAVALAVLLRWAVPDVLAGTPYLAFYPAVVAAAAFGGGGPGLLATVGSALCVEVLFDVSPGLIHLGSFVVWQRIAIFLAGGTGVSLIGHAWRLALSGERRRSRELQRANLRLQDSEQRFRQLFQSMDEGFCLCQMIYDQTGKPVDWRYLEVNPAFEKITGLSADDLLFRLASEAFPDIAPLWRENYGRVVATGHSERFTDLVNRRGRQYEVSAYRPVPGRFSVLYTDITERKHAEDQIRLHMTAIESAANAIVISGADGTIQWVNPAFTRLTGYSAAEAIGANPRVLNSGTHDQAFFKQLWKVISSGQVWHGDMVNRRKDGSHYTEEMTITPVRDAAGQIKHYVAIKQDITERKRAEEETKAARISAERAMAVAEDATRAKDHFLAVLSHELRTPLTPVLVGVPMVQKELGPEHAMAEIMDIIRRNVELEARLIDDLLDVTRIARGKIELNRKPVELGTVIRHAVEVCQSDIDARELDLLINSKDEPCMVNADAARLQQAFWNLIRNAVKFTPHGGCVGVRSWRDDGTAVIEVSDSGVGIEPDVLPHIFNAFEQGSRSITRRFGGLGLGLAITRSLVDMHGGSITAYSQGKGKGATFRVTLPIITAVERPTDFPTAPTAVATRALHILLIEDHADTARIMKRLLKASGHEVTTAGDVASALAMAERGGFDLLISDLGLPDGSGLDLMRQLVAKGKAVPAIALSGYGQDQDVILCRQAGFAAHLTKPVNMDQLTRTIAAVTELPIAE